jgi:hypothetical protein
MHVNHLGRWSERNRLSDFIQTLVFDAVHNDRRCFENPSFQILRLSTTRELEFLKVAPLNTEISERVEQILYQTHQ